MKRPNFFILGAPKCGTTSMASWLAEHPQIFMSPIKEPFFFNFDYGERWFSSLRRYEKLFEKADNGHIAVGEASTRYLYSRTAVPAILEYATEPRFIVMVRNPVDMAYSLHEQTIFSGNENEKDFESAWRLQSTRIYGGNVPNSCIDPQLLFYGKLCCLGFQIERLYEWVPRDRVLLINLDYVRQNTVREYRRVLSFLNVDDDGRREFPVENTAKIRRLPWLSHGVRKLNRTLHAIGVPYVRVGFTNYLNKIDTKNHSRPAIRKEFSNELRDYFLEDINLLESLSGWNLEVWK